ncbi:hypothetical protein DSO57_1039600 [Entomophthora muscae]|uniref:Uncharacterized protein n=1 Tax=Entomophthora muscae TaxID=34485 RepID=A0ACC2TQD5_9FUNG|nr:hypothetical protein DSO57_1039600 [Entomophthora muscae]
MLPPEQIAPTILCVWLLGTPSRRTGRETFITKDLRFKASLGLAFRAKLRCREYRYSPRVNFAFSGPFQRQISHFAFASQNKLMTESGNTIFWFLDSAHLTCLTHACGE